jgi:hypothetical protein
MDGLVGGFLSLVDSVGGRILYALIGSSARKDNKEARANRLILGGFVLGSIVGMVVYVLLVVSGFVVWYFSLFVAIIIALVFACFVFLLEGIRIRIDEDKDEE